MEVGSSHPQEEKNVDRIVEYLGAESRRRWTRESAAGPVFFLRTLGRPQVRVVFGVSTLFLVFMAGLASSRYHWAPERILANAESGWRELRRVGQPWQDNWYYKRLTPPYPPRVTHRSGAANGINLVTRVDAHDEIAAEIIDLEGRVLHRWEVDWFKVWPNADHVPKGLRPKAKMNTHLHGAVVLSTGDLIFNYDYLGLVRMNKRSEVVWRLPYQTHHSVHLHDDGTLWVCGQRERKTRDPALPHLSLPYDEFTVLQVSLDGKILNEWRLSDILVGAGYDGLYFLGSEKANPFVRGDLVHLNDVEPFPSNLRPGIFGPGDLAISMRNISTVFVFNRDTRAIKAIWTGRFIRQHDPDFLDGDRLSIYDNNVRSTRRRHPHKSRIVILSARDSSEQVYFEGDHAHPFYSNILGKHQWLPNGNLLVTESMNGRAFELDRNREIVWEYVNIVDDGLVGIVEEVQRLPAEYRPLFDAQARER